MAPSQASTSSATAGTADSTIGASRAITSPTAARSGRRSAPTQRATSPAWTWAIQKTSTLTVTVRTITPGPEPLSESPTRTDRVSSVP